MKKKFLIGAVSLSASIIPLATVLACGSNEDSETKYVSYSGGAITGAESYFVTDGGSIEDKSFNQSGFEGWAEKSGQSDDGEHVLKPTNSSKIIDSYNNVKSKDGKLIVAMGFNHATPLRRFSQENPEIGFVLVDSTLDAVDENGITKQQGNVLSIVFKTEQAAFLEGLIAAKRAVEMDRDDPKIGWWGGMEIPSVTSFINGLTQGVEFYNKNNNNGKDVEVINAGYVGNFEAGNGKEPAESLLADGAELLLGVAGPQSFDAIKAIKDMNKTKDQAQIIGVDTDMSLSVEEEDKEFVFDSIQKGLKEETERAVEALLQNTDDQTYGFGKVVQASLEGDGVKITNPSKLDGVAISLGKSVDDLKESALEATA